MPLDVPLGGQRIGEHHRRPPGRGRHQPGVEPHQGPAPVGRQQQRDQVVDGHHGGHRGPQRRAPVGHVGQVGPPAAAGAGKGHLLEPAPCPGCSASAARGTARTLPGVPGTIELDMVRGATSRNWCSRANSGTCCAQQTVQVLPAAGAGLVQKPGVDGNSHGSQPRVGALNPRSPWDGSGASPRRSGRYRAGRDSGAASPAPAGSCRNRRPVRADRQGRRGPSTAGIGWPVTWRAVSITSRTV